MFAALHPAAWKEIFAMAKTNRGGPEFDLQPIVETMGLRKVIEKLGKEEVIEELLASLTPAKLRELQLLLSAESEAKGKKG
jgi:hypothetical protein